MGPKGNSPQKNNKKDDKTPKKDLPADDNYYERFLQHWADQSMDEVEDADLESRRAHSRYSRTDLVKVMTERLQAALHDCGFPEDYRDQDCRILFCLIGTLCGAYTALKLKYPKDAQAIQYMVALFAFIFFVVSYIDLYKVGASCLYSIKGKGGGGTIRCALDLPDFSDEVTFQVSNDEESITLKKTVGHYFDEDGFIVDDNLVNDFIALLNKLSDVRQLRDDAFPFMKEPELKGANMSAK